MASLKIQRLISGLNARDTQRWLDQLTKEKTTSRPDMVKAARYLLKLEPLDQTVDREKLFSKAYPGKPYDDLRLRHVCADLLQDAENFILKEELKEQSIQQELLLLRAFRRRGLDDFYRSSAKRLEKLLQDHPFRNMDYHYFRFLSEAENTRYLESQKIRTVEPNLEQTTQALDDFFLAAKMHYSCSKMNHATVVTEQYSFDLVEESMEYIRKHEKLQVSAIGLYYHVWCMLNQQDDEKAYKKFRERIPLELNHFPAEEGRHLYVHAINYCIKKIREGKNGYLREAFTLYQEMLERKVFFEDGFMSPWMYKNVTVAGLRLGEADWVSTFLEKYRSFLAPKFRDTAYTYNSAKVAFEAGNLDRVLQLLQEVEYQDIFYALDSKAILLKTYFELEEDLALDALCSSFRVFLNRRREVSESHRKSYLNLIRLIRLVVKARQNRSPEMLDRAREELGEGVLISDKAWLLRQMEKLETDWLNRRTKKK